LFCFSLVFVPFPKRTTDSFLVSPARGQHNVQAAGDDPASKFADDTEEVPVTKVRSAGV